MKQSLGNLVHPIMSRALEVKRKADLGENPNLESEQTLLRALLMTEVEATRWPDFGGDVSSGFHPLDSPTNVTLKTDQQFLGVRYALVCWLDELFILHSPLEPAWNERKLEVALYGTNNRAWKFWEQARLAETRVSLDALEVFYLCVMLGFRGELLEEPGKLRNWCRTIQQRLSHIGKEWTPPPEIDPPTNVTPLRGNTKFRSALWWTCVLLLFVIPVAAFIVVQRLTE